MQKAIGTGLVAILGLVFWSGTSSAEKSRGSLHLGIAAYQAGSPLAIVKTSAGDAFPFQTVSLQNTSGKVVSSVTLGILLAPMDSSSGLSGRDRILVKSVRIRHSIERSETVELGNVADEFPAFSAGLDAIRAATTSAELGVVRVQFDDGIEWKSQAPTMLHFPGVASASSGTPAPCPKEPRLIASTNPYLVLAALQCDPDSKSPTNCSVSGSTCTMTPCSCAQYGPCYCGDLGQPGTNCECRKCVWH